VKALAVVTIVALWVFGLLVIDAIGVVILGSLAIALTVPLSFVWGIAMYFIATWIWDRMVYKWR